MKIAIIGTGYVGLVTGACFAEMGNQVHCVDVDNQKIKRLKSGESIIYEPGLDDIMMRNYMEERLIFTSSLDEALATAEICFVAVGTPMDEDGSADLQYVLNAAREIGREMSQDLIIVDKSTVPIGTADKVTEAIQGELNKREVTFKFTVVSNPEFLKEGSAVEDFMRPDRIVIGAEDEKAVQLMKELYSPFIRNHDRFVVMDVKSAEMAKYASNAMLAARISFMNEMANICERVGANINMVRLGMGSDSRIGYSFLYAGCGYGGSCFPKDIQALIKTADESNYEAKLLKDVQRVNEKQKLVLAQKVANRFGEDLRDFSFGIWGLAFKPETDDIREAPSTEIIKELLKRGARIKAYDPQALRNTKEIFGSIKNIEFRTNKYDAINEVDALLLITEWKEFRSPDFDEMKKLMRKPIIFDGRNQYNNTTLRNKGFEYYQIGVKDSAHLL